MKEIKEQKQKAGGQQWIGMLLYMLIGAASGVIILRYMRQGELAGAGMGKQLMMLGLALLSIYAAMAIQIVIHEAGHLVFGLVTGYRFSSFRVFGLMWQSENGKVKFRRFSLAGTGGQCLMVPPDLKDGKMPFLAYNFGGSIFNLISAILFAGLAFLLPAGSFAAMFLLILALVSAAFALMNGLPMHMGPVDNDGCNALAMMRSDEAVRAFWIQMKVSAETAAGKRVKEMPAEWFAVPSDEAMGNNIIAVLGAFACSRLMDEHRFAEADELMAHLLSIPSGIAGVHRSLMTCDRIFVALTGEGRPEAVRELLTKEQTKLMKAMKNLPTVLRTEFVLALLADRDKEKAEKIEAGFDRCAAGYPYPAEIEGERELMAIARERAEAPE